MLNFKNIAKIVIFCIGLLLFLQLGNFLVQRGTYARLMMHEMYHQEENIDIVFLGSSHTYRSFAPYIFDKELDINSFNMGTSSQSTKATYYLLKEVLKKNNPQTVIMEITYSNFENIYPESLMNDYILIDNYKFSLNKMKYSFDAIPKESYAEMLFPVLREKSRLNLSTIRYNMRTKWNKEYFQYQSTGEEFHGEQYAGKGFVYGETSFPLNNIDKLVPYEWNKEKFNSESFAYLRGLTELCKKNNIEIIWVTAPVPDASVIQIGNYGEVHNTIVEWAKKYKVEYYDFNYAKPILLEKNDNMDFYDASHMNGNYAEKFSMALCKLLKERKSTEVDNYFYPSYEEWYASVDDICNVWIEIEEDIQNESTEMLLKAYSNKGENVEVEYRFWMVGQNGTKKLLQDFSEADSCIWKKEENKDAYFFKVEARKKGEKEPEQYGILKGAIKGK